MTPPDRSDALSGAPLAALGTALVRANESGRADRLLDDPLARVFAEIARAEFGEGGPDTARSWETLEQTAQMFAGRIVAVRFFDDYVREAVEAGCGQVVLLGAGLDTRAYRLALPAHVRVFEVDLPVIFDFKERVLAGQRARPTCRRAVLPADLRGDWSAALPDLGFQRGAPTAWLDEGALSYLPRASARNVILSAAQLSASGSRYACGHIHADHDQPAYRALREPVPGGTEPGKPATGLGPAARTWLRDNGWPNTFHRADELAASYGRAAYGDPRNGFITATRKPPRVAS